MKTVQHLFLATFFTFLNVSLLFGSDGNPSKITSEPKEEVVCSISDFVVTPVTCEGEILVLSFSFTGIDFGLNGYTFGAVGDWSQTYNLGDDQFISLIALCNENREFYIFDNDNPNCMATFNYGSLCCDCEVDIEVLQGSCNDGVLTPKFDILYNSGSCGNYDYSLQVNGTAVPFEYNRNSGLYETEDIISSEEFITYVICTEVPDLNECFEYVLPNPCFTSIGDFTAVINTASCVDGSMTIPFSFTGENFGLQGFTINTSIGISQSYMPGDVFELILPAACSESVLLTIVDDANPNNFSEYQLGIVCCPCGPIYAASTNQCQNESFIVNIDFGSDQQSCGTGEWTLAIGDLEVALYQTNTGYATSALSSGDSLILLTICSVIPGGQECYQDTLVNPCYQTTSTDTCQLTSFVVASDINSCRGEIIDLNFSFQGTSFGTNGYTISANTGFSQTFSLADTTLLTLLADCDETLIFTIRDNNDSLCTAVDTIASLCCPCEPSFSVSASSCVGNSFNLNFVLDSISGSCINHDWSLKVNGDTIDLNQTNTGFIATGIQSSDSLIIYELCTLVPGLPECFIDTLINPCFQSTNTDSCQLTSFVVTSDINSCRGEIIDLNFSFDGTSFGTNGYTISSNTGFSQSFSLADTTLITLLADCDETLIFTIRDINDSLCTAVDTIAALCCPCEPSFSVNASSCVGNSFNLNFVLDSISGSCINYDWSLTVNGDTIDLSQTNTGFIATGIQSSDSLIIYELCTLVPGLPECFIDTLINPCFQSTNTDTCQLTSFVVTSDINSCRGEIIDLNFSFEGTSFGTNRYTVSSNTGFSQTFSLADTTLLTLLADCDEALIFTITDANDGLCTAVDTVAALCCPCDPLFIVNTNTCEGDSFSINFVIESNNGSCINYDWSLTVNGEAYDIIPTNFGYTATGIQSADSLIIYEFCTLVPGLPECYTLTAVNPCFETIVSVKETQISDLVRVNMVHGQQITLDSKHDQPLQVFVYNVNGQQMPFVPILGPLQSTTYDITTWPAGLYVLKVSSSKFTSSMKLMNVR